MPKRSLNVSDKNKNKNKNGKKTTKKIYTTFERGMKVMICSECPRGRRVFYSFKRSICYSSKDYTEEYNRCYWGHPTCSCVHPKKIDEVDEEVDEDFEIIGEIDSMYVLMYNDTELVWRYNESTAMTK